LTEEEALERMQMCARGYLVHIFRVQGLEFIIDFDADVIEIHHDNEAAIIEVFLL